MSLELQCPACACQVDAFAEQTDSMPELLLDCVGDGQTIEDTLYVTLSELRCPECDSAVPVSEERLGQLAMSLLTCC
jgi:hypothetical protein